MYLFLLLAYRSYIFVFWYSRQEMFIRWGNSCTIKFRVTNGVKQGSILSPALFNVYMNNLSVSLWHWWFSRRESN